MESLRRILSVTLLALFTCATAIASQNPKSSDPDLTTLLAKNPAFVEVKISPNGRYLAVVVLEEDKRQLLCLERDTLKPIGGARMVGKDEVGDYFFANNERLVMKIMTRQSWEKQPKFYGELYGVNCDGSQKKLLFGYRIKEQKGPASSANRRAWADVIHRLPQDPDHILITSTNWTESKAAKADIFKLNVYTGKLNRTGKSPIGYADIVADSAGKPRIASGTDENYEDHVYLTNAEGEWQENQQLSEVDNFRAFRLLPDQSGFYFSGRHQTDLIGLYQYDFATQKITAIYQPKTIDLSGPLFSSDGESIYAARIDENYPNYLLLNKESADTQVFRSLTEKFAGADVSLTSQTEDGRYRIARVEADRLPPVYFLHDRQTDQLTKLIEGYPHLHGIPLVEMQPVEFSSFDKTLIRGYVTLGAAKGSAMPMVVLIHGGPYGVRDYWEFDSQVQMLALAGYNVMQINYRGSKGYGEKFSNAADLQWGNAVQQDIIAGTKWAIAQGVARKGNICIMGGSFGAYSALQSSVLAPDLFKCAIGVAGIYDLSLLTKEGDITRLTYGEAFIDDAIGKDAAQLRQYSPVYQAHSIQANVLLIHGEKDQRAPLIHAELMQKALTEAEKEVELTEYDDEAHGFYAEENQIRYYHQVLTYLETQLKQ